MSYDVYIPQLNRLPQMLRAQALQVSRLSWPRFGLSGESSEQIFEFLARPPFANISVCDIARGAIIVAPRVMVLTTTERVEAAQRSVSPVRERLSAVTADGRAVRGGRADKIEQRISPSSFWN